MINRIIMASEEVCIAKLRLEDNTYFRIYGKATSASYVTIHSDKCFITNEPVRTAGSITFETTHSITNKKIFITFFFITDKNDGKLVFRNKDDVVIKTFKVI